MQRFTLAFSLVLAAVAGCDAPPPPAGDDAGTDAPPADAGIDVCESADDCDDGTFCNGVERCAPSDADADARGCAPADVEACMPSQECDEAGDACLTMCDVERDADGDGVDAEACGGIDCDDADGNRYPGNTERCDADDHDEDCDPETFGFRDGDMDARGDARCCNTDDAGEAICGPDCDDSRPDIFPGQVETCDGSDNDCDGTMDETVLRTFYVDLDDDGYGDESAPTVMGCVPGPMQTEMDGDCDDTSSSVSPVSPEICDVAMVDENCDGTPNPPALCMCEGDVSRACSLPGRCASGTERCIAGSWGACSIAAVTEICNAEDDDCDGRVDEMLTVTCYSDGDDDGYPTPSATPSDACPIAERTTVGGCPFGSTNRVPLGATIDCNDAAFDVRPGATELCDASMVDENCDGMANPNPPCACSGSETRPCSMPGRCSAGIETCAGGVWGACSILAQAETCNGVDDDCDGTVDDGVTISCFPDGDDDTYSPGGAAMAVCAQPGRGAVGGCPVGLTNRMPAGAAIDCNDGRPDVYPGATEICDAAMVDESCDGMANPNPPCACSGSMTRACPQPGRCGTGIQTCASGAWGSCSISPETESCNGLNDDCDSATDEGTTVACYTDSDNDTYSPGGAVMNVCPVPGRAMVGGCPVGLTNRVAGAGTSDCNDASSAIYPGAAESCTGSADDDCDGMTNEGCMCTVGMMRPCMLPGQCATGTETCSLPGPAWVCNVSPTAESCNSVDDDCDGTVDDGVQIQCWVDMDGDTYAPMGASSTFACSCPAGTTNRNPATAAAQDCNDGNAARFPGAPEVCNIADDDCDGMIDDGLPLVTVYFDTDGDAHSGAPMMRCAGYPGSEPSSQDCNESNPAVYVGATEVCDRTDNNCSSGGGLDAAEDMDGDDYAPTGAACTGGPLPKTDCDDTDAMDNPGMPERCGGGDNDCDGMADEEPAATSTCTAASATSECVAGACRILACAPGTADCDASYANGCEVTLGTSATHCGGCGNACGLAATCSASQCDGIVAVQTGGDFSCALRSNGRVVCWGDNQFGQLGDPAVTMDSATPVEVVGLTGVAQIALGYSFACARRTDNTVWCWGRNYGLELGIGSTSPMQTSTPQQVVGVSSGFLTGVQEISAGDEHACARLSASPWLVCWGENGVGQLGRGSMVDSSRPVGVLGVSPATELTNVTGVSAGGAHTCARRSASPFVVCWGNNGGGQLGDGTTTLRTRPVQVSVLGSATTHVAAGGQHTCARTTIGSVFCWGDDFNGQVGNDGATTDVLVPTVVPGVSSASDVWVGDRHSCARTDTRVLYCWGDNGFGQLGDNTTTQRNTPVVSRTDDQSIPGHGGNGHSCVLRASGQVGCWGKNDAGQLGDGSMTQRPAPITVINLGRMTQIAGGDTFSCTRRDSGELACWGSDYQGRLGNGLGDVNTVRPTGHWNVVDAVEVSVGHGHACARRASGAVACWGDNPAGQTGNGVIRSPVETSVAVTGLTDAISIGAGASHTCAARTGGGVQCWGDNAQGQLGDGTIMVRPSPVAVSGITTAAEVVGGESHSCARLRTGEVWCWGDDSVGQLGNGMPAADSLVPVQVTGITSAVDLSAGDLHTCALLATGEIQCWGADSQQQLGNGAAMTTAFAPVTVSTTTSTMTDVVELFGGGLHTCARRVTGQVVCWGANDDGELGLGDTSTRDVPTPVPTVADGRAGGSGEDHTCVIRTTGQIACAGSDLQGQIGDGNLSTADQTSMVPVVLMP